MTDASVILPTYNEAENIEWIIDSLLEALSGLDFEIIVVDDNSPDGTSEIVTALKADRPQVRLVTRLTDRGLLKSIKEGIKVANSDVCVWMDADMTMQPSDVHRLLKEIDNGADLAFGSRYVEGGSIKGNDAEEGNKGLFSAWKNLKHSEDSFLAVAISQLGNITVRYVLDRRFYDYTSGFYAVRKHVFDKVELSGHYLDYCISFLHRANMNGFVISEVPVVMTPRIKGVSKTSNSFIDLLPIIFVCLKTITFLMFYRKR